MYVGGHCSSLCCASSPYRQATSIYIGGAHAGHPVHLRSPETFIDTATTRPALQNITSLVCSRLGAGWEGLLSHPGQAEDPLTGAQGQRGAPAPAHLRSVASDEGLARGTVAGRQTLSPSRESIAAGPLPWKGCVAGWGQWPQLSTPEKLLQPVQL